METRQLEYFVAVAEELNFTRAARRLFATQSTVSASIRALESDLGTALFVRSTKHVALTSAGEVLLPEARTVIEGVDRVRSAVAESSRGLRGRLRVGIFTSIDLIDLPTLFGEFHARHPLVDLELGASATGSTGLADDVLRGRIDVAFTGLPASELTAFAVHTVQKTRFVVVLPAGHPLSDRSSLTMRDVAGERFVDTPAGFGNRVVIERAFAEAGLSRTVTTEVSDLVEVPKFIAASLGIGVIPEAVLSPHRGIAVIPLVDPVVPWELSIISRKEPSQAVTALLALFDARRLRDTV
ncbi:LysR family transcriptional regulator [Glaciihabitans sp. dw_435]|uniref:LysR family transcriptional regulator n=1 Tax=Glaciihabitans sp. dw_435 TaxID=2720081 RepID=UPI001BD51BE2|nr:LysR family transcriptional regulator [Glaciihabitans sp. dw_435]